MCNRYSFALNKDKICRRFEVKLLKTPELKYNIAPGQEVFVVADAFPGVLSEFIWGMQQAEETKKTGNKVIYTVATDSVFNHIQFKNLLQTNRCLILADGFYCWKKVSKKGIIPYRTVLKWNLPFAMAGIWNTQMVAATGNIQNVCAILSTTSNSLLNQVEKRMPAILPMEYEKKWLDQQTTSAEAFNLLQPYPAENMRLFPVSSRINATDVNFPELTQPAEPTDQFGNYILFT